MINHLFFSSLDKLRLLSVIKSSYIIKLRGIPEIRDHCHHWVSTIISDSMHSHDFVSGDKLVKSLFKHLYVKIALNRKDQWNVKCSSYLFGLLQKPNPNLRR